MDGVRKNLEKLASIDAQLRLLAPGKVSEDDNLVEYDALLLDRFLDILQDLHGEDLRETVSCSLFASPYLPTMQFMDSSYSPCDQPRVACPRGFGSPAAVCRAVVLRH